MIKIEDKRDCCGCSACQQICPHHCITMEEDDCGFHYPKVDLSVCVNCHLCENVCPVLNRYPEKEEPMQCYLGKSLDEDNRSKSSSGGIFMELASEVIREGGVVFGVRFDENWQAIYDYAGTIEGVVPFRGSKYIQADPNNAYTLAKEFLTQGRRVFFTGTPCVIAGLNHFLRKKYDNLLTLDFVCHSIPSPKIWKLYLKNVTEKYGAETIKDVSFRDKSNGWFMYSTRVVLEKENGVLVKIIENKEENIFMRGFFGDLYSKPSCSKCPARKYTSNSDITVADAWHIDKYHPERNDEKGMSHILINTDKGKSYFQRIIPKTDVSVIEYSEVEPYGVHATLLYSCKPNRLQKRFYKRISKGEPMTKVTESILYQNECIDKCLKPIKKIVKLCMGRK